MDTRVFFYAFTPYHLFHVIYYTMQVKWEASTKKYLVWYDYALYSIDLSIWKRYFEDIFIIPETANHSFFKRQWKKCLYEGRLFSYSKPGKFLLQQKQNNILICFSDQHECSLQAIKRINSYANNTICMIEEGAATYAFTESKHIPRYRQIMHILLGLKTGPYIGHSQKIDAWIVKHPEMLPKTKLQGGLVLKQNNIFMDRQWTHKLDFLRVYLEPLLLTDEIKTILWVSGPLEEHGVKEEDELKWLQEIAQTVQGKYRILIKKHPRERKGKYVPLLGNPTVKELDLKKYEWIPLEFFAQLIHPEILLTVSSSAAFNLYEMGLPVKLIYSYKHFKSIKIDKEVLEKYLTKVNIYSIGTIDELHHVLYELPTAEYGYQPPKNEDIDVKYLEALQK